MAKVAQILGFATPFASLVKDGKFATGSEVKSTLFDPRKLGGGTDMFGALKSDKKKSNESVAAGPLPVPEAPKPEESAAKASETSRRRRINQTQTVYSSPLGVSGEANVARKTLTGQ